MHKTKSSLKLLAVIAVALSLAVSALLARLWLGPISVNFLTPYLQQALLFDRDDISLRFDDTELALEGVGDRKAIVPALKIRLTNVRVYDRSGARLLSIPSGAVGLSISGLLHGMIAPSTIEIAGPTLHVDWRGEDIFADFGGAGAGGNVLEDIPVAVEEASADILPFFIRELLSSPGDNTPTGYLRRIRIIDANLILHEQISDTEWTLPGAQLEFARSEHGVSLLAKGVLQKAGMKPVKVSVSGVYDGKSHATGLKVEFRGLNPAQLAGRSQTMSALKGVDLPLDGVVFVTLGPDRRIMAAGFDLDSGAGMVGFAKIYPEPVHFDQIKARGRYDRKLKQFTLDSLSLLFGPARLEGEGLIYAGAGGPGLQITGDIAGLPLLSLKDYWPHGLAPGAYDWVAHNITGGTETSGHFNLHIAPDNWGPAPLPEDALDFQFKFTGVEAHYLRPMPPVMDGAGYARLTTRSFDLTVLDARVGGLKMAESHVHFSGLQRAGQATARIDLRLSGPLSKALALVDSPPLGYPTHYGLAPDSASGKSDIGLDLEFPLTQSITLKDVTFDVNADLRKVAMPHLFQTIALDQGAVKMHVDRKGISTIGKIALNLVPFDFSWKENFGDIKTYPTRMTLGGSISGSQWTALGLPAEDYVKGPARLDVTLQGKGARILAGQGRLDLGAPEISLERLGWSKPAGARARLAFQLEKDGERLILKKVAYQDDTLAASGSLTLGANDDVETAALDHFKYGETALSAIVSRDDAGRYGIVVKAAGFDARPLIRKVTESKQDDEDSDLPNFTVTAEADRLLADSGTVARQVRAELVYENNLWANVKLKGKFENSKRFSLDISPSGKGRSLVVVSDDAGELGRALGLFHNAAGGALTIHGNLTGPVKTQKLKGEVEIKDFKVVKAPVLGNILTVGSLTGIGDLLKGDGITFERLDIPFTFQNGAIALEKSRAYGPAIGITMEGGVDLRYNSLNLNGTIVPAYTLNSILKIMPLVGNLLMGGKGEGLFALTYKVTGPVASPRVDVNPLAVLAPGFLRSMMSAFGGSGPSVSPERKAAEKKAADEAEKEKAELQPQDGARPDLVVSPVEKKAVPPRP